MADDHIPVARLVALADDNVPETAELQHLVKCRDCFDLMTKFIKEFSDDKS